MSATNRGSPNDNRIRRNMPGPVQTTLMQAFLVKLPAAGFSGGFMDRPTDLEGFRPVCRAVPLPVDITARPWARQFRKPAFSWIDMPRKFCRLKPPIHSFAKKARMDSATPSARATRMVGDDTRPAAERRGHPGRCDAFAAGASGTSSRKAAREVKVRTLRFRRLHENARNFKASPDGPRNGNGSCLTDAWQSRHGQQIRTAAALKPDGLLRRHFHDAMPGSGAPAGTPARQAAPRDGPRLGFHPVAGRSVHRSAASRRPGPFTASPGHD